MLPLPTKVDFKIFEHTDVQVLEEEMREFLKDKDILQMSYAVYPVGIHDERYSCLVVFRKRE